MFMNSHVIQMPIVLTPDQEEAAALVREWFFHLDNQIFVLCGYAGRGQNLSRTLKLCYLT